MLTSDTEDDAAKLPEAFLRVRLGQEDAHYVGGLIAGAKILEIFGDVATELLICYDGDKGLLRAYDTAEFLAPVYVGDFIEVRGRMISVGITSRRCEFEAHKVISSCPEVSPSAAEVLAEPVLVAKAVATAVVLKDRQRYVHTAGT